MQITLRERPAYSRRVHPPLTYTFSSHRGCVRLASQGRPRCVAVSFSRTNVGNYLHTFVLEKNPPHTGVDPGKLNERTLYGCSGSLSCGTFVIHPCYFYCTQNANLNLIEVSSL